MKNFDLRDNLNAEFGNRMRHDLWHIFNSYLRSNISFDILDKINDNLWDNFMTNLKYNVTDINVDRGRYYGI